MSVSLAPFICAFHCFPSHPCARLFSKFCFCPTWPGDRTSLRASFRLCSPCRGDRYEVCVLVSYTRFAGNVHNLPRVPLRSCVQLFFFGGYLSSGYIFLCRDCSYNGSWVIFFYHSSTSLKYLSQSHSKTPLRLARTSMRAALAYKCYTVVYVGVLVLSLASPF